MAKVTSDFISIKERVSLKSGSGFEIRAAGTVQWQ
jgi:hypothetical protein